MRLPVASWVPLCAALCLAAVPALSHADTIYLKNGRKIIAADVLEKDGRVSYETSAGPLSLPASIVDRVVRDGLTGPFTAGRDRASNLPIAPPNALALAPNDEVSRAAVRDGSIDAGFLRQLQAEASANPQSPAVARLVTAESAAAQFEVGRGDLDSALAHYRTALRFAPGHTAVLLDAAYLRLRRSEYTAARELLDRARRTAPDSPDVAKLAGWALYGLNKVPEAVAEWKRAFALQPDEETRQALAKAERDALEEAAYREGITAHFLLRYSGGSAPELAREVLRTLEDQFREIASALDYTPPEPVGVILYTNQAFTDITRAPSWAGALNDGRLRVPVEGLSSVTPELARVLKHELVHSFLMQKTRNRCPVWLQEGIAQYLEGRRSRAVAGQLSAAYEKHMEVSLASFESSWLNLPQETASAAYAWSLAVVEYIVTANGIADINRILERIAAESTPADSVRSVLRETYQDLMGSTVRFLRRAYLG